MSEFKSPPMSSADESLGLLLTSICRTIAVWDALGEQAIPLTSEDLLSIILAEMDRVIADRPHPLSESEMLAVTALRHALRQKVNEMRVALELPLI